ncbi:hypothetical protein A28LD_1029 [Idiomarina sp. A28L]|uniref:alpha/beta fold hydrolase n=1 Tax=Idiomarina sp. A28L TaxID=1036674 RepID=UPI0002138C1E|nr:alpha/beta hydrolase [Idiomarina sp. A28L]EGN75416.1 hypothetical protein A28LD_1029 [Idiomarina sp. A28L]
MQQEQKLEIGGIAWLRWQFSAPEGFMLKGVRTPARGLPVLHFIHGNSYSGLTYLPLWQQLAPHFDIFLHDAQGHGDSEHGGKFVGWGRSGELAAHTWKQYSAEYPNVPHIGMGHSFGGALTSLMSSADKNLFQQLLLLDPMLFPQSMIRWAMPLGRIGLNPVAKKARRRRMLWPDEKAAMDALRGRGMFRGWQENALAAYVQHAMEPTPEGKQLKCLPEREAEIFSTYVPKLWRELSAVTVPTFVWIGKHTYPFLNKSMAAWKAAHPNLSITEIEGGHCFMQEDPETIAAQIRAVVAHQYKLKA